MAGKKTVATKRVSKKTTPARETSFKDNLVAMEEALEKGAADLGRRAKKEMPVVKEATVKAATWLVNTAAEVTENIRAYLVDLWRKLTAEKKARVERKPAAKKVTTTAKRTAAARKPTTRKRAAPRRKAATAKRTPARRKPAARKTTAGRSRAKKRSTAH